MAVKLSANAANKTQRKLNISVHDPAIALVVLRHWLLADQTQVNGSYRRNNGMPSARLPKSLLPLLYEDPVELGFLVRDFSSLRTPNQLPRLLSPLIQSCKGSRLLVPRWSSGQETRRLKSTLYPLMTLMASTCCGSRSSVTLLALRAPTHTGAT
ncbi:unnamed protein product [Arctia plantaginis]|uniref:Uncharacterized protein n=1 Tax=Arctia plantaginis TaxID=874455 RepID=A0A8S0YSS2_ARCPL|nr:unnamed protein product [Arctia plantaginis]